MLTDITNIKNELFKFSETKKLFQDAGDNIRLTGNPFLKSPINSCARPTLAIEANKIIKYIRSKNDNKINYFVVNSFRNPSEVQFFRERYSSFYLCSLYASKAFRKKRLGNNFDENLDDRDAGKHNRPEELNKQDVPRCALLSDYAITTEKGKKHYEREIVRFLTLIDFPGIIPPRNDEELMNLAYSLSLKSTCLSRQVGAVITNSEGFVTAAGWNAVGSGQLGCSLVTLDDYKKFSKENYSLSNWSEHIGKFEDNEIFASLKDDDHFCFKDLESKYFLQRKIRKIFNENSKEYEKLKNELSVKRLEYARSLHAEENAILQAARFGGTGIAGGTIYTTTYPCELCSKKIYQAQLSRIVYTEPYPDSLSETIFLKDGVRQISIEQFEGVKSPSFFRLFKPAMDLKEYQIINNQNSE